MAKSEGTFNASRPAWAQALDATCAPNLTYRPPADDEITSQRFLEWIREREPNVKDEQVARGRIEKMVEDGILEFVGMRKNPATNRPIRAYKFVSAKNAEAKQSLPQEKPKNSRNDKR